MLDAVKSCKGCQFGRDFQNAFDGTATMEYQATMERLNMKITPGARVEIFVLIALFGAIFGLNDYHRVWFRPQRPDRSLDWGRFRSFEEARIGGRDDAKRELARGTLRLYGGDRMGDPSMSEFIEIMSKEYHIEFDPIFGCLNHSPSMDGYANGFNGIMEPEIERRFGKGLFGTVWRRAKTQHEAKKPAAQAPTIDYR